MLLGQFNKTLSSHVVTILGSRLLVYPYLSQQIWQRMKPKKKRFVNKISNVTENYKKNYLRFR